MHIIKYITYHHKCDDVNNVTVIRRLEDDHIQHVSRIDKTDREIDLENIFRFG